MSKLIKNYWKVGFGLLLTILGFIFIALCVWYPITNTDIWWHLASAREILQNKSFLYTDPFCLSSLGEPWVDLHWGFQLLVYSVWNMSGAWGLLFFKSLVFVTIFALLLLPHYKTRYFFPALLGACFCAYHMRFLILIRPTLTTMLGLMGTIILTEGYLQGRYKKRVWLLPIIQLLMVNSQGLFPLGFAASGLLWAGWLLKLGHNTNLNAEGTGDYKHGIKFGRIFGLSVLAGLINPYGLRGFLFPLKLLGRITPSMANVYATDISENTPLFLLWQSDRGVVVPFLWVTLITLITFEYKSHNINWGRLFLFTAFLALGIMARRNISLYYLVCVYVFTQNLKQIINGQVNYSFLYQNSAKLTAAVCGLLLVFTSFGSAQLYKSRQYELPGSPYTPFRYPVGAVEFLNKYPVPGNIFNSIRYGGYLNYYRYPGRLSFVDGRMIIRSREFFENYLKVVDNPSTFGRYAAGYGITHVMLPISEFYRYLPLCAHLQQSTQWCIVFCDGASILFVKTEIADRMRIPLIQLHSSSGLEQIQTAVYRRFGTNSRLERAAQNNVGELLRACGQGLLPNGSNKSPPSGSLKRL